MESSVKYRICKINSLVEFLYKTDISVTPIDEMPLERLYEAQNILNSIISESNILLDGIDEILHNMRIN